MSEVNKPLEIVDGEDIELTPEQLEELANNKGEQ